MQDFNLFKIEDSLKDSITRMKFKEPTSIQSQAIPIALQGKDILGTAQTGTGKTLAFGIPLINKLILDKNAFALVTCPTRELATQVMDAIKNLISDKINIKTALLIGGQSMQKQLRQLGKRARLIVGTPGRINDHLKRKSLNLSATKYLVLDETDRMLDMGFTPQIEKILKFVPKNHQTLLFSATLPKDILRISERYLTKPTRISVGSTTVPIAKIKQETLQVYKENKYNELIDQLLLRKGSILVFVKTKRNADRMVKRLKEEDHSADAIHGDLRQSKRDRVMNAFRKGVKRILVATDVAARGLDIPLISLDTLEILSRTYWLENKVEQNDILIPMLDARRMEVYTAIFDTEFNKIKDTEALILQEDSFDVVLATNKCHFFGDGAEKSESLYKRTNSTFSPETYPSAKTVAEIVYKAYLEKSFEDTAYFEPYYLKDFLDGKKTK